MMKYFFTLFFSSTLCAMATQNSELRILNRCYSQLVKKRIPSTHYLVEAVKSKKLNGSKACIKFIDEIKFNKLGVLGPKNEESLAVLRTFQRIHDSWFPRFNFNVNTQDFSNTDLYDSNEMGYHFTWVLLKDAELLKNVLTKKRSFWGIRESEKEPLYFVDRTITGDRQLRKGHPVHKWKIGGVEDKASDEYYGPISFWDPKLIKFGKLVGLRPYTKSKNRIKKWLGENQFDEFDIHEPQGGGIIGTVSYLLLNAGQNEEKADGGGKLHRRWSTSILNDLLCRSLPTLTHEEAQEYVQKKSTIGFRKRAECMSCHMTIDPMAAVLRNLENYNSGNVDVHYTTRNIYMNKPSRYHHGDLPDNDFSFYETRPSGHFIYKDIFNKKVSRKVKNIAELGRVLSETPEFYMCLTKRYFEFFTGIKVNLEAVDWKKPAAEPNYLKELSFALKKDQNPRNLIYKILESPFYRAGNE